MILSVDPGLRGIGAALFDSQKGDLLWCAYVKNPVTYGEGPASWFALADHAYEVVKAAAYEYGGGQPLDTYVVELMWIYQQNRRGNPNDLIQVAAAGAAVGAAFPVKNAVSYTAKEWKGQTPKKIHNDRVIKGLKPEERAIVDRKEGANPPSLVHNTVDAVGLGLYHLEKLRVRIA